jgi:hypothetical protein
MRHKLLNRRLRVGVLIAFCSVASVLGTPTAASAHCNIGACHNWGWIWFGNDNDQFYNYDNKTNSGMNGENVDWDVHFIFWGNAEVDYVKNNSGLGASGSGQYLLTADNSWSFNVDADGGRKSENCAAWTSHDLWAPHLRVYAAGSNWGGDYDRNWDSYWGFYVIGTDHWDYNDPDDWWTGCSNREHGWSESAEYQILAQYYYWAGWTDVVYDDVQTYTWASHIDYLDRPHHHDSDGWASTVHAW